MERISILIKGQVQGVYFRAFIKERAEELGLKGYTKNIDKDSIETVVEGHEAKVKKFLESIKKGPNGSIVEEFKISKENYTGEFNSFKIKY